ncbi:MAG: type II toxin-antitoxin system VapC family toxin [Hyphomicrobiaceae bacterium]|nr:MAG: type II toxin-antitoxin system VapC family toxin [Hyphomicrobiaceae bacterium]
MRLLLDTHIWIDLASAPERLGRQMRRLLSAPDAELYVSPISAWEFLKLAERKRIRTRSEPHQSLQRLLAIPLREAPITFEIARELAMFSLPHRDPADAWLVATARVKRLALATRDENIIKSGAVETLTDD